MPEPRPLPARNVCRALFLDVDGMLPDIADNRTGLLLEDKVAAPALNYRNAPGAASRYHIGSVNQLLCWLERNLLEDGHWQLETDHVGS